MPPDNYFTVTVQSRGDGTLNNYISFCKSIPISSSSCSPRCGHRFLPDRSAARSPLQIQIEPLLQLLPGGCIRERSSRVGGSP